MSRNWQTGMSRNAFTRRKRSVSLIHHYDLRANSRPRTCQRRHFSSDCSRCTSNVDGYQSQKNHSDIPY